MKRTETMEMESPFLAGESYKTIYRPHGTKHFPFNKIAENKINNPLKTPEEIEADFIFETSAAHSFDTVNKREVVFKSRNDNTENSDTLCSGFMEENY